MAKVLLFPADLVALGPLVNNIATDSWWGPYLPATSSLDPKLTAKILANNFMAQTGREWVQGIGSTYSLFEVAREVFTSVSDPHDKPEVARALHVGEENVRVIVPDFGAAFGGKYTGECSVEAARLAKGVGKPVSLRWTRQEEFTWAYFRPAAVLMAEAGLDAKGKISSWHFININSTFLITYDLK